MGQGNKIDWDNVAIIRPCIAPGQITDINRFLSRLSIGDSFFLPGKPSLHRFRDVVRLRGMKVRTRSTNGGTMVWRTE